MRLGLDYFPAATHAPGVGRYARELTRALVALETQHDVRLLEFGRAPQVMPESTLGLNATVTRCSVRLPARMLSLAARAGLGADRLLGGVDVFHHVRLFGPEVSRARQTFAISEWPAPQAERALIERLRTFDALFVFCSAYRERLIERAHWDPRAVHLLPVGADHWMRDLGRAPESVTQQDSAAKPAPPQVLVLGAALPDRQHVLILDAVERLERAGLELRLVFAGSTHNAPAELRQRVASSRLGERLQWSAPDESAMPELVASSALLVHLCADAGTAVTPLEALLLGAACLVSPVPAFKELLGDSVSYFAGAKSAELATAIESALQFAPPRAARAALAEQHCWRKNALASLAVWEQLA